jgi:transposase
VPEPEPPSYEQLLVLSMDLAQRNEELAALVMVMGAKVEALEVEVASLRRQVGRDSSNSSQLPSQDGPVSKATAKAVKPPTSRAAGKRSAGGQKGHRGTGSERVAVPGRKERVEPPACGGCGGGLAGTPGRIASAVQVFDIPQIAV